MCGLIFGVVLLVMIALPLHLFGVDPLWAWGGTAVVVFFLSVYLFSPDPKRRYVIEHGEHVMGWMLPGWAFPIGDSIRLVMVVYTFDKTVPDLPQFLERVMNRMRDAAFGQARTQDEREVAHWIQEVESYAMYTYRLPVPASLTEGREVFCIKTRARKELLPNGELKLPYIYIAALPDYPNVAADMVEYPDAASNPRS